MQECPKCRRVSADSAILCDCGFAFDPAAAEPIRAKWEFDQRKSTPPLARQKRGQPSLAFELGATALALVNVVLCALIAIANGRGTPEVAGASVSPLLVALVVHFVARIFNRYRTPTATAKILCTTFAILFALNAARWNEAKAKSSRLPHGASTKDR